LPVFEDFMHISGHLFSPLPVLPVRFARTVLRPILRELTHRSPLAFGTAEFGFVVVVASVLWSAGHPPHWSPPVMPLGLPDLHATFDAFVLAAQVLADQPVAGPVVVPPAVPVQLPVGNAMPGLETVLVNLGGWAAILWGLANKIISRLDSRIVQIERQLEKLATMPRAVQRLHREIRKHRTHMHGQPSQADPTPETPS
jgi:hypothetical protein